MDLNRQILSDITVHTKYARHLPELKRRETWEDAVLRNMMMNLDKFPELADKIVDAYQDVYGKNILPSMRAIQFSGRPILREPNRIFNCSYCAVDDWQVFSEIMFLLLGGSGVGYSVEYNYISKLPAIEPPKYKRRYLIHDNLQGWADAIKVLFMSFMLEDEPLPIYDYSDIRKKGSLLKTSGGRAPGSEPLQVCLEKIKHILEAKLPGTKLTSLECHDIICIIADAVLTAGSRRAALLAMFNANDFDMLTCKSGNWWVDNPQRARANNSVVLRRNKITKDFFLSIWNIIKTSNCGEPGIIWTNEDGSNTEYSWGLNPCTEISLKSKLSPCQGSPLGGGQFCNLATVNLSTVDSQEEFERRVRNATFIATLQASYTDFHYLRLGWKESTEDEALVGISLTGIAEANLDILDLKAGALAAVDENQKTAKLIGINSAARVTCLKPEGSGSLVAMTTSGVGASHGLWWVRRMRFGNSESITPYLLEMIPELMEIDQEKPTLQHVLSIPVKAKPGSILRSEPAINLLQRVKKISEEWIAPGHVYGLNRHSVSATISIKDHEWEDCAEWMWQNRNFYTCISVLPYDGGSYVQAPFEEITEERYNELSAHLKKINLADIVEETDETNLSGEISCGGGKCEL